MSNNDSKKLLIGLACSMDRPVNNFVSSAPSARPRERVSVRDQDTVSLSPKAFETLLVLAQRCERVVLKDDLMKTLWPTPLSKSPISVSTSFSFGRPWATRRMIRTTLSPSPAGAIAFLRG